MSEPGRALCGAYECWEFVENTPAARAAHLKERHPDLFGVVMVPVPDAE